jgi:hypothetical protein
MGYIKVDNSGVIDKIIEFEAMSLIERRRRAWDGLVISKDRAEFDVKCALVNLN